MYVSNLQAGAHDAGYNLVRLAGNRSLTDPWPLTPDPCKRPCGFHGVCRLGTGTVVGQEVGVGIMSAAPFTGPAAPIVAAVGEVVDVISKFFGGGCGQACVQSATLEQVPEVALDDLDRVTSQQPGAISGGMFEQAWQAIINYGTQQLQQLEAKGDSRAAGGITNLQKSTDYSSLVASLPAEPTVTLDVTRAQSVFTSPSASGYEPGSVSAGNALALQVLQAIAASSTVGSVAGSAVASIETSTGLPGWLLVAAAAGLAWMFWR